jgi:predicted amidohydrolase
VSLRVACVQMNTRGDAGANVRDAVALVEAAAAAGATLVALPETWAYKGGREGIRASTEAVDGPSNAALARLAAHLGIYVLAGSIYETSPEPGRAYNTSALFGPDGGLRAAYRKIHLFDVTAGTTVYRESDDVTPGGRLVTAQIEADEAPPVTLGLTVCYDLRFPELYRSLALRGAQVLCVPAAFTAYTGAAHWEVLLRARAVENGCFVIAPGQVGEHLPGRECFGHSMIVDPWGAVLAEVQDGVGFCVADLDLGRLTEVRAQIPSLQNRRPDVYEL